MQEKNKKGFTLIELLAVIIILAVIALIAIPEVIDIIAKARKSAFEDSVYGIIRAGEMYYTNELLENGGMSEDKEFIIENGKFKGDKLPISGSLPNSGKVKVTSDGDVALVLSDGKYYVQKTTTESEIEVKSLKEDKIKEEELDYKEEPNKPNPAFTISTLNPSIPACITNNTTCSAGTGVAVKVNNTTTYDFYVMSDNTREITLIMNKNLGGTVAWASKDDYVAAGGTEADYGDYGNNKGPITALKALEERTSGWTNIPYSKYDLKGDGLYSDVNGKSARARLLTKTDASNLGCTTSSGSCPDWLYENLNSSSAPYGYWTSSAHADSSISAWFVIYDGYTYTNDGVSYGDSYGVRPVITISKSVL